MTAESDVEPEESSNAAGPVENIEDAADTADLVGARQTPTKTGDRVPLWRRIGPGLITGAADDDPSGIGTYSVAGAQYGYGLLWLVPVCIPLMIAVQEMCGRLGAITGKGLAGIAKEHYARWVLLGSVFLLLCANVFNIYADLNVMGASTRMLFNNSGSFKMWLTLITVLIVTLQTFVPYRRYVNVLKWLTFALLSYAVTAFWPGVHHDWGAMLAGVFRPHLQRDSTYLLTLVGFIGTTISPYLFFWQASETVEDEVMEGVAKEPGDRIESVTVRELKTVRMDTAVGMIASQIATFFIMICTAATLHRRGITSINTAQEAAAALRPLGHAAYLLFTLGILGTGFLAIPTLSGSVGYAVAETMGWRYGLFRRFSRAKQFYLVIAGVTVAGYALNFVRYVSPIKALLYSAVLNAVVSPPLIILLLLICNNSKIVGSRRNGIWGNGLGIAAAALMTIAAGFMFYALAKG